MAEQELQQEQMAEQELQQEQVLEQEQWDWVQVQVRRGERPDSPAVREPVVPLQLAARPIPVRRADHSRSGDCWRYLVANPARSQRPNRRPRQSARSRGCTNHGPSPKAIHASNAPLGVL